MRVFTNIYNFDDTYHPKCTDANARCMRRHLSTEKRDCLGVGAEDYMRIAVMSQLDWLSPVLSGCWLNVQKAWYAFGSVEVRLGMVLGLVATRELGFRRR